MAKRFEDQFIDRPHRFSLGMDRLTGEPYLSTPITKDGQHHLAEYEAYFRISADEFARFRDDPSSASGFIEACRSNGHRDRLIG
jgi:hypothetical protein